MLNDYRPDPAWQRDSILLLCYSGVEDLTRAASDGIKESPGFDLLQLNAMLLSAFVIAICWLSASMATGVLDESRYDRQRVLLTWLLAAPFAAFLRLTFFGDFPLGHGFEVTPMYALIDAVATLALQLGLRLAEEQGYV